jgi:hypothetical protein
MENGAQMHFVQFGEELIIIIIERVVTHVSSNVLTY